MDPGAGSSPTAGHELVLHEPDGVFAMNDNFPSQHAIRTGVTGETTSPTTARQSLFPATTLSSPSARSNDDTSPPSMSAEQLDTVHRPRYSLHRPLSTLTGRSAPLPIPLVGSPNQSSSSPLRTRIPRIEKDVDDPSTPLQTALSPDHGTPTTLSRLFAMRSGAPDSRSTSYNTNVDSPARDVDERLPSLAGHLYTQGLLSGKHSDITVVAFGCSYKLHRLMLSRSPFFNTALSGQWLESNSSSITLHPEDVDCNINKTCFELALKRLYGAPTPREEIPESIGLFATGCWLEMTDLIDSSIKFILNNMNLHTLSPLIRLVTNNYYGRAGDKILASAKAMLCRDGWRMPLKYWDKIPADIVREIVGGDGFFVDGEWERWLLTRRIVLRRLRRVGFELGLLNPKSQQLLVTPDTARLEAIRFDRLRRSGAASSGSSLPDAMLAWVQVYAHPDVEPLLVLMDEGIHYMHLDFERLQGVRAARDPFAVPLMPDKVLSDALWMQMELRENILNSPEGCMELGLSQMAEPLEHSDAEQYSPVVRDVKGKQLDGELLTSPTTIRPESKPHRGSGQLRRFWIPSTDCSIVMGGNAGPVHTAPTTSNLQGHALRMSSTMQHENVVWTSDFGAASAKTRPLPGLRPSLQSTQHPSPSDAKPIVFTRFPPFRFSADFPNPRLLKEKKRVYSRTIFYAGSLWNIYIQKVKTSRNSQLGVYLHRAKEREVEAPYVTSGGRSQGSVDERIGLLEREMLLRHTRHRVIRHNTRASGGTAVDDPESSGSNEITGSASGPQQHHTHAGHRIRPGLSHRETRQTSDEANASSNAANHGSQASRLYDDDETSDDEYENTSDDQDDLDNTFYGSDNIRRAWPVSNTALLTNKTGAQQQPQQPSVPTLPPYVDARPTIKTYFKIYSPSKGGRMLSVYESAPDRFNFSQSWGWKSSTLMLDEGMDDGSEDTTPVAAGGGADNTAGGRGAAISPDEVGAVDEESSGRGKDRYVSGDGRLRFMVVIGNV